MRLVRGILLASAVTFAPASGAQTNGFYAGLGGGYLDLGQDSGDIAAAAAAAGLGGRVTALDDKDFGWKIFGGYQFNIYFAAEFGYTDLGEASATFAATTPSAAIVNVEADGTALSGSIVGTYPLNRDLGLFGRFGAAYWDVDGTGSAVVGGSSASVEADDDGIDLLFGLGARYSLTPKLGLRLEWEHYRGVGDDASGTDGGIDFFGGSLMYRF